MDKTILTSTEKEQIAFRVEMLTILLSVGDLIDDIHETVHATPEDREKRSEKNFCNEFGVRLGENRPFFVKYIQEARKLPDDEELFFESLLKLSNKVSGSL